MSDWRRPFTRAGVVFLAAVLLLEIGVVILAAMLLLKLARFVMEGTSIRTVLGAVDAGSCPAGVGSSCGTGPLASDGAPV